MNCDPNTDAADVLRAERWLAGELERSSDAATAFESLGPSECEAIADAVLLRDALSAESVDVGRPVDRRRVRTRFVYAATAVAASVLAVVTLRPSVDVGIERETEPDQILASVWEDVRQESVQDAAEITAEEEDTEPAELPAWMLAAAELPDEADEFVIETDELETL